MILSAIAPLVNAIAASPYRVAPESTAQLDALVAERSLALEFSPDKALFAALELPGNLVRLGTRFLELLWTAAYAYIVIFHECQRASNEGAAVFGIGETPRTAHAYTLYRQALQAHAAGADFEWPATAVRPERFPAADSDGYIANEMFLVAVSWIIHHEIAHARMKHQHITVSSAKEENDADRAATRWVCGEGSQSRSVQKSAMGVVVAVILLLAYELESPPHHLSVPTHPPPFERLVLNLEEAGVRDNDVVYAFALKMVEIHLLQVGLPYDVDPGGSYRDKFVSVCLALRAQANGPLPKPFASSRV